MLCNRRKGNNPHIGTKAAATVPSLEYMCVITKTHAQSDFSDANIPEQRRKHGLPELVWGTKHHKVT